MNGLLEQLNPDWFVYLGSAGMLLTILFLMFFLYRRARWLFSILGNKGGNKIKNPGILKSIKNFLLIIIWLALFGMVLFAGLFFRAYYVFTLEEPVAKIATTVLEDQQSVLIKLTMLQENQTPEQRFLIRGDQWMLEGDILKWDNWLNFMGFHTRYRLTRIRGRYQAVADEISKSPSVFTIGDDLNDTSWKYLYRFGEQLPFVSTVYGNAVFQNNEENGQYLVYVSSSGFTARRVRK